jgi:flagellar biosynthesis chaperone FliJ
MKNWKSLFVKSDEEEEKPAPKTSTDSFSFPVGNTPVTSAPSVSAGGSMDQSVLNEVVAVYEKGVDSINMPGYDFYEFYKAISTIGNAGEQAYNMAYQMAKSMDGNITPQKLVSDAEFYISKINEVHSQYTMQGQQKLNSLEAEKNSEKNKLMTEIEQGTQQVNQLRNQLQALESEINQKRITVSTVDGKYHPQESSIRQKLLANDNAKQISITKLLAVKEGIQKNIKS